MKRFPRLLVAALSVAAASLVPFAAHADDPTQLNVVGTSDVYDSNLVQSVIGPGFEKAYPQYKLNYISKGTGAAIAYAEQGSADAMIVHAASLENQFVADGYSLEKYGRAIFWGDYVLLGPQSDPADVMTSDQHDVVGAFEKIAAAGAAGQATFVSRGGTPGTTVAEHAIWALTQGTTLCTVSAANGGGSSPSTGTGACSSPIALPSWYKATGLTQGPNVLAADQCPTASYPNGNCYALTDRGTYAYLKSTGAISNLKIVARDNASTATGGQSLLVNSFHAYAINPAKFTSQPINSAGATAFLTWITSVDGQKAIGKYLSDDNDPPFIPSAAPSLTVTSAPAKIVKPASAFTVKAKLANVVPGTPSLSGVRVTLFGSPTVPPVAPVPLVSGTTDANGVVSISYKPSRHYSYSLATAQIATIEDANLNPVFGDLLAGTTQAVGQVSIQSSITLAKPTVAKGRKVTLSGTVSPKAASTTARVELFAKKSGRDKSYVKLTTLNLRSGVSTFSYARSISAGKWTFKAHYLNPGYVVTSSSNAVGGTVR